MGDYILEEIDKKFEEYEIEMKRRQNRINNDTDYVKRTHALLSQVKKLRKELNTTVTMEDKELDKIFYRYFPLDDNSSKS
jgi:hypothetical protein